MDENKQYKTVDDAVRYLTSMAWRSSSKSIYRHIQQGKIPDKPWSKEELNRYAAEFLRPMVQSDPVSTKGVRSAAHELIEARKEKLRIETDLKNFDLELKKGSYIEVVEHSRIMAAKLMLIRDACSNWIRENVAELIRGCHGDQMYCYEVVELYQQGFASYWARLDTDKTFPLFTEDFYKPEILE